MSNISVYAEELRIEGAGTNEVEVHLQGVDVSQVIAEFSYPDVLDSLEFSDVANYVQERLEEENKERNEE